jgi:GNAT superfamily N-acetyltransferase
MKDKKELNIDWEPLSSVPGLTFRHFAGEEDYSIRLDIANACKEVNHQDTVFTLEDIKNDELWTKNYDIHQHLVYVELDGTPVGYFANSWETEPDGKVIYYPFGSLLPDVWGRSIAALMLRYAEEQCRQIATDKHVGLNKRIRIWKKQKAVESVEFFKQHGYGIERNFYSMNRPIDLPLDPCPLPEGIEIRPVEPAHYRAIWDADNEAFRDHWGYSDPSEEMYQAHLKDRLFQPHAWKIAWEGDQVVAGVHNIFDAEENETYERKRGYTEDIFTRRPWRGKGIAKALIAESIRMFRDMGMEETHLGVDADNTSGALRLYQNMGYQVEEEKSSYMLCKMLE